MAQASALSTFRIHAPVRAVLVSEAHDAGAVHAARNAQAQLRAAHCPRRIGALASPPHSNPIRAA